MIHKDNIIYQNIKQRYSKWTFIYLYQEINVVYNTTSLIRIVEDQRLTGKRKKKKKNP